MKIQATPDYLIFADESKTGELLDFPNVARGWGLTIDQTQSKPPMEWMNGAFNRIDKNMLYMLQQGIPEWNEAVLYPVNAIIKYKGVLYTAILQNDNAIPSTNTTKWSTIIDGKYLPATKSGTTYNIPSNTTMDNSAILTENGYSVKNFQDTGYQKLPSGLIIQWGSSYSAVYAGSKLTITLPITVTTANFQAMVTMLGTAATTIDRPFLKVGSIKTSSFNVYADGSPSSNRDGVAFRWFIIGY